MEPVRVPQAERRLIVPSRADEVATVRKAIGRLAREDGFGDEDSRYVELAVGEGVANAVRHGSPGGEEDTVEVVYQRLGDNGVEVIIRDHGVGFDLEEWLEHVVPLSLSEGQRGLVLMAAMMDEVAYTRSTQGGCLRLRKYVSISLGDSRSDIDRPRTGTQPAPEKRSSRARPGSISSRRANSRDSLPAGSPVAA